MSRQRSGRKAHETHIEFINEVGGFAEALGAADFKHDRTTTGAMVILRITTAGAKEVITFAMAYSDLYDFEGRFTRHAFSNISEAGLYDMLADTFLEGTAIHTTKAEYRLWNPVH